MPPGPDLHWDPVRVSVQFGYRVRALREERGWRQEQLAELAQLSRNQIQNIEHSRNNQRTATGRPGPGNPTLESIVKLGHAFGIAPSALLAEIERTAGA